ncbi:MAG: hypothetical protein SFW62_10215 [Alphaproteobacteria bacterium]|nr:hypothetical protein [Alphaproteobacteria bacterium]
MKNNRILGLVLTILVLGLAGFFLWLGNATMPPQQQKMEQAIPDAQIPR